MSGYPDGTFKPNGNVTRAELSGVVQNLAEEGYIDTDLDLIEQYEAIKIGKTTEEDLIKKYGECLPGPKSGEYHFYTKDHSIIYVSFNNDGTVSSKWGVHPPKYPQVTEQNLKKLESGMSYEQVSIILGGKGMFFDDMETKSEKSYGWSGTEGGSRSPYAYLVFDKVGDGLSLALDDRSKILYK